MDKKVRKVFRIGWCDAVVGRKAKPADVAKTAAAVRAYMNGYTKGWFDAVKLKGAMA